MKKTIFHLLLILLTASLYANPLHTRLKHNIIIDTDCSVNDLRAVSIMLSHPGITVKAIIVSEGEIKAKEGYARLSNLLRELQADTIPLFYGEPQVLKSTNREKEKKTSASKNFMILPAELFQPADTLLTLICLGPLTNISREIGNNAILKDRVEEVIWYIDSAMPLKGFNSDKDRNSADRFLNSGIRVDAISNLNKKDEVFGQELISQCKDSGTKIAKALYSTRFINIQPEEKDKNPTLLSEETVALFLANHELFELTPLESNLKIRYNIGYSTTILKDVIRDMITGRYRSGHFVALYGFPIDPELYTYDVREILKPAISKYGPEEWKACTLTDEFHGHLGVFSIVGAKMGIFAREHFGIGTDLLEIVSYAGSVEPFSCMNDGLQVSTGATLGQGSIHFSNDTIARPHAVFRYNNKSILVKLKDEYLKEIKTVIEKGVKNYGLQDEDYWNLIRQTAIKFWLVWDRKEIFDLIVL